MRSPLDQAIIRTLAYHDVFDYPLTAAEIWRWLMPVAGDELGPISTDTVAAALESLTVANQIAHPGDYFTLPARAEIVKIRAERFELNKKKWRRAKSAARFLEIVPFVKLVAVANTVALHNGKAESDIDLFIIIAPSHLWMSRLMITAVITMLGYRRHGQNIKDRICLSFFVTTKAMNLEPLKLQPNDPYLENWVTQIVPLVDDGTYQRFIEANAWARQPVPHGWDWPWTESLLKPNSGLRSIRTMYEVFFALPIGWMAEQWARNRQLKKMEQNEMSKSTLDTSDVIINDDMLKFHEADRRAEYRQKFQERCQRLGLPT